jgi:hypothetical protein
MPQPKATMEQLKNESTQDYVKFLVFLRMGSSRSMDQAFKQYYETSKAVTQGWYTLAEQYSWAERVLEYDKRGK